MAKEKKNKKGSRFYLFAGILVAIIYCVNAMLVDNIYWTNANVSSNTQLCMNSLNRINAQVMDINLDTVSIAAGLKTNIDAITTDTNNKYNDILACEEQFESIEGLSDLALKRYNYAKAIIATYKASLDNMGTSAISAGDYEEMNYILKQDIYPLQVTASEMLTATIDVVGADTGKANAINQSKSFLLMYMMLAVAILGEVAIWFFARRSKKAKAEIEEREKNLAEVDAKLKSTRQKASDLAIMNVLTGMKNRYALDNEISDRLESGRFQIAVFDMDNFRSINDTYGYDFGDEYLAAVAERLKAEFGDVADMYNITGNEFCFVFNKNISESQAMGIAQNIQRVMSSPFEVLNLAVQLPCSGAVYHYLPGDCLNVNSLLVKLDTAMRNAKLNGGNMISTVMNI
jgi:diguanylate cyclase (GGDEF)-like protein